MIGKAFFCPGKVGEKLDIRYSQNFAGPAGETRNKTLQLSLDLIGCIRDCGIKA
jgi:hypothetical protein